MSDIVEEARELLAQATPGPWNDGITEIDGGPYRCTSVVEATCNTGPWGECGGCELRIGKPDRALIAAAPRLLAALADEIAQLRADLARVTAERDARPEISREDAERIFADLPAFPIQFPIAHAEWKRIETALRAHAAGSGKGGS